MNHSLLLMSCYRFFTEGQMLCLITCGLIVMTARLRATLVRISQGLEDQRSKNAATANNQPSHLTASSQLNHADVSQMGLSQGASSTFLSAINMYGLKVIYV